MTKMQHPRGRKKLLFKILLILLVLMLLLGPFIGLIALYADTEEDQEEVTLQPGDTVTVELGSFRVAREQSPNYYLPKQEALYFEHSGASLAGIEVRNGEMVEAGDVLLTFSREEDLLAREQRRLRLEDAEAQFVKMRDQYKLQIDDLTKSLAATSDSYEYARLEIELSIAKENLRYHLESSALAIAKIEEEIALATEDEAQTELIAPFSGQVVDITSRKIGDRLAAGEYMCTLIGQDAFLLEMDNGSGEYRQGSTVTIEYGPAKDRSSIEAEVVADQSLLSPSLVNKRSYVNLGGIDPAVALQVVNPRVTANTISVDDVLIVPRKAVTRQNQNYYVNLQSETGIQRRYIQIVSWNQDYFWVQDGLSVGDKLVIE